MGILDWLFRWTRDNRDRNDRDQEAERKISPAMPMAGAGAQLDAQPNHSETEEALKRASDREQGKTDAA